MIRFAFGGKRRFHKPDFVARGVLLEVKSPFTLGVGDVGFRSSRTIVLNAIRRKANAAANRGYTYRLVVVEARKNRLIVLHRNWQDMNLRELAQFVRRRLDETHVN